MNNRIVFLVALAAAGLGARPGWVCGQPIDGPPVSELPKTLTAATSAAGPRFALLVGVQQYPHLAPHEQLAGCENDTHLIRQLLADRFGFRDSDIVVRTNDAATGQAIREEFSRLVQRVRSLPAEAGTAQVVFHFSGHGSQVPDQPEGDPNCDELEGLDETLVPYDATKQGGAEDIRDDELHDFLDQLCADGKARVWAILDCCHSGTGARGATRFRSLERGSALPLDPEQQRERRVTPKRLPDGAVLLAACRANEKEPEYEEEKQSYGLLTRFLTQALNQADAVSRLSYDALRESLEVHYRLAGVSQAPTPQLEGGRGGIVLGADASLDRKPFWKVRVEGRSRSSVTMAAGALHGVTAGSLFEVYQRPDQIAAQPASAGADNNGVSTGWVRIDKVDGVTATGSVFRWDEGGQLAAELPSDFGEGYAVERHHACGDFALRVRVVHALDERQDGPPLSPDDETVPGGIREMLARGGVRDDRESRWLRWVSGDETCDVLVRLSGDYAAVFPAAGKAAVADARRLTRGGAPAALRGGWGPVDVRSANAGAELQNILRPVTRARNLLRVAALSQVAASGGPQVKLELVAIDVDGQHVITPASDKPWPVTRDDNGHESLVMRDGSLYTVRLTNLEPKDTGKSIFVTVLHIDANMGIDVLYPYQPGDTDEQRIPAGESRLSGPFQCNAPEDPPIHGSRTAIALATREPHDFEILAQPSLPVTRGTPRGTSSHAALDDLLIEQTYFRTRGGTTRLRPPKLVDGSWATEIIPWFVVP